MSSVRINEKIAATKVVLITASGENKGEVSKFVALDLARNEGLDLVEVSQGRVPVCRIMDYGKMLYQKAKAQKKNHTPSVKEVRINFATGEHDLERQKNKAKDFLSNGHKVVFFMKVKGREKTLSPKSRFFSIVKDLSLTVKLNDIQENDKGFTIVISP